MKDEDREKEDLIDELSALRQQVAELKVAEIKRKEAEEQLHKLYYAVEQSPVTVVITDHKGSIEYVNPKFTELTGYTPEEVIGQNPRVMKSGEQPPEFYKELWGTISSGKVWRGQFHNKKKNGELYWEDASISPVFDGGGRITHYIAVKEDITERKQMEEELKESIEQFTQLANNIDGVFWLTDLKEEIVYYVSPAYEKIFGRRTEDIYRDPKSWLKAIHPDDRERVERTNAQCRSENCQGGFDIEYQIIRPDGSPRWVRERAFPVRDISGKVCRVAGIAEDITERKRAEEEKERLQAQLIQAQKMEAVGTLAGGVAHDFNNIMTVVKSLTSLALSKADENDHLKKYIEPISDVSERAIRLVQQLLIFSQAKPAKLVTCNLNDTVDNLLDMLISLVSEDISIEKNPGYGLWNIEADEGRVEQVITNLIVNSSDAMPLGGKITLSTENFTLTEEQSLAIHGATPGNFVCLMVEDTGTGMDKDTIGHIFEPFFTTRSPNGTGLGLSVVYSIVKELNGWIDVSSEPGQGAKFRVCLRTSTKSKEVAAEELEKGEAIDGKGQRILLVEDDKWVRKSTAMVLSESGYIVFEAANAEIAISIFYREKGKFDLVLSDVVMPGKSGLQMVDPFLDINPNIPILLFSGHIDDKVQMNQIIKREIAYIQKPFEIADLLKAVEETIGRNS